QFPHAKMSGTPFSLSFAGGGFLAIYEIGVIQALLEQAPEILRSAPKVYGASSGSLMAAAVVCKVSLGKRCIALSWLHLCKLHQTLPENSHQMATGRLYVSLTRLIDGQNVVVSEYSSKEELIQVLICSCFVPIYAGFIPPSFRGVRYVDGGFTNLQPCSDLETAITVSPFTGETDICPRDCPAIFYSVYILQANIQISLENLCRFCYALFPPSWQVSCFSSGRRYVAGGSPSLLCTGSFRKAGKAEQLREVASTTSFCQIQVTLSLVPFLVSISFFLPLLPLGDSPPCNTDALTTSGLPYTMYPWRDSLIFTFRGRKLVLLAMPLPSSRFPFLFVLYTSGHNQSSGGREQCKPRILPDLFFCR
uniref:PNPLA domain-containing protein n=1 Tax=Salvator merianae TaxID=96440 RepID=A0A8D0E7C8_SALMN